MRFLRWTNLFIFLCAAIAASSYGGPRTLNSLDTVWRYTNLPPDGREARLIEESRREAARRTGLRQPFEKEELMRIVSEAALRHGVEPELLCAIAWTESRFHPYIESNMGAQGLLQLMPNTAPRFGVLNPLNPVENAEGGARLFRWLLDEYDNDLVLALAAYNAGTGAVKKGGKVPPFSQTRQFVVEVLTMRDHFRNRPGEPAEEIIESLLLAETRSSGPGDDDSAPAAETPAPPSEPLEAPTDEISTDSEQSPQPVAEALEVSNIQPVEEQGSLPQTANVEQGLP